MPQPQGDRQTAVKLKDEGNALYQKKDYEGAKQKYTLAIKSDPESAVLYANRAAVFLATKQYSEAVRDARKCIQIDTTYTKAWGRLGKATHALGLWQESIDAYSVALLHLYDKDLTDAETKMKHEFLEEVKLAQKALEKEKAKRKRETPRKNNLKMPGEMAAELLESKYTERSSCVHVVASAQEHFKLGMEELKLLRDVPNADGTNGVVFSPRTLAYLTNSILADERVFHITDPGFLIKVRQQTYHENSTRKGWMKYQNLDSIKRAIIERLEKDGWDVVKPTLSTTVRGWILQGYLRGTLLGHHEFAESMFEKTLDLLEWGREQWPEIGVKTRGVALERAFIRGVKRLRLQNMQASIAADGTESAFSLQQLIDAAEDLSKDIDSDPWDVNNHDKAWFWGHWVYAKAWAISVSAWAMGQVTVHHPVADFERLEYIKKASDLYRDAAVLIPPDDPFHIDVLKQHLHCLCHLNYPLRDTLPVAERIRLAGKQAREIWQAGPYAERLEEDLEDVEAFETRWKNAMARGECDLSSARRLYPKDWRMEPFSILIPNKEAFPKVRVCYDWACMPPFPLGSC